MRISRHNVRASAGCKQVDGANNALKNFSLAFEVRIVGQWRWDGVDGETRVTWCHVGNAIHGFNAKLVSYVFCECFLGEVGE